MYSFEVDDSIISDGHILKISTQLRRRYRSHGPMNSAPEQAEASPQATWPSCLKCGISLPIRPKKAGEQASDWRCAQCGAAYHAVLLDNAPLELLKNAVAAKRASAKQQPTRDRFEPQGTSMRPLASMRAVSCREENQASKQLDSALSDRGSRTVQQNGPPFMASVHQPKAEAYDEQVQQELVDHFDKSVSHVELLVERLEQGKSIDADAHETVVRSTLVQATKDLDLFVKLGINPLGDKYPARHSLHVSMLAAAIGANLGWDRETIVQVGIGCLIHDLGMLLVPDKVFRSESVLSDGDFGKVATHPLRTFDLLEEFLSSVPLTSRMVAYQIHERCNGSGYPRKRRAPLIHQAAKVAAVADVYVAMVSPRPHREPVAPYYAIEYMIRNVPSGMYDSAAIRGLLNTISLFPIGSFVELTDGRRARVLRSHQGDYTRPVVEAWQPAELDAPPDILQLSQTPRLRVKQPLTGLAA